MSKRWRSKPHYIDVVRFDHDGPYPIEADVRPSVPAPLAEFIAEAQHGETMTMVEVTPYPRRGAERQWIVMLLTASDHGESLRPGDALTRDGRGLYHVLTADTLAKCYDEHWPGDHERWPDPEGATRG